MSAPVLNQNTKRLLHTLLLWMPLWTGTAVAFGILGAVYAYVLKQDYWLASQAILVRDEANSAALRLGRFDSETQMKAAQETILEVARHEQVVTDALKSLGPEPSWATWLTGTKNWPSNGFVKATANSLISIRAPKGAEFGATEVIYLDVKQTSPKRALDFNRALSAALESRLQQVRKARAESIRVELIHARDLAREQLKQSTESLSKIERSVGLELSDLRGMTDMIGSGGTSRIHLDQLKSELRAAEAILQEQRDNLKLLEEAIADPAAFIVAPSAVVNSQPGLKRLREGYAEAQLTSSQLSGRFTEQHPLLEAARETQSSIQRRLVTELEASRINVDQEIQTTMKKIDRLKLLQGETEGKLSGLADHRAEYANCIAEVKTRTAILEQAERELAEAEAAGNASSTTSLISKLDEPIVSENPIGPGRMMITAATAFGGLIFGLGLVFVLTPSESRRFGRRASDVDRRQSDRATITVAVPSQHQSSDAMSNAATDSEPITSIPERINRAGPRVTLANKLDQRPAPVFYDETTIQKLRQAEIDDETVAKEESIAISNLDQSETAPSADLDGEKTHIDEAINEASEHPSDPAFRNFLLDELAKTNDRRQHPRPVASKKKPVQFGLRPSNKS